MNIRFEYLYRDAGNFKNWGAVVFTNPRGIAAETVATMAERVLIDDVYFEAPEASVPDLHFPEYNDRLDHGWHEVHAFQLTSEQANDLEGRTIDEFLESLRLAAVETRA